MCNACEWCGSTKQLKDMLGKTAFDVHESYEHYWLCEKCLENAEYCENCGKVGDSDYFDEDFHYDEETGVLCKDCWIQQEGFEARYKTVSIDAWRSYQSLETHGNTMKAVECYLVPHDQNQEIIDKGKNWLTDHSFKVKVLGERTSNVFSVNLIILAKKENLTDNDREALKKLDDLFVDYYTKGFSILSGKTYEIDLEAFQHQLDCISLDHYPDDCVVTVNMKYKHGYVMHNKNS
jgi:hypothetical protein